MYIGSEEVRTGKLEPIHPPHEIAHLLDCIVNDRPVAPGPPLNSVSPVNTAPSAST